MILDYAGDDPKKNRMVSWFQAQLRAIGTCLNSALPEAALSLIYSGIDSFGLLGANANVQDASGDTFKQWCELYILPRMKSVEGDPITSVDLWAARCGILHTSTPLSKLEREGRARQVWYQFMDKTGVDMRAVTQQILLCIDVVEFAKAFKEGGIAFIKDVNSDPPKFQLAESRAQHFLRWATVVK